VSQRFDLSGIAGKNLSFNFTLTGSAGPLDLAGITLTVYLKATSVTPDSLATVYTTSSGLTVTNTAGGQFTWAIPAADVPASAAPGALWYRVDVDASNDADANGEPAMYGALRLTAA
jgi:hypothetical protein